MSTIGRMMAACSDAYAFRPPHLCSDASEHTSNCRKLPLFGTWVTTPNCRKSDQLYSNWRNSGNCRKTCITAYADIGILRDRGNLATFTELDLFVRNSQKQSLKWRFHGKYHYYHKLDSNPVSVCTRNFQKCVLGHTPFAKTVSQPKKVCPNDERSRHFFGIPKNAYFNTLNKSNTTLRNRAM